MVPTAPPPPPDAGAAPPAEEGTTDLDVFDALFARALQPTGDFARALKEAGWDPQQRRARYPMSVWRACVLVACRHAYPELPEAEALWHLGRRFVGHYLQTVAGQLVAVGLPLLGPERGLKYLPRAVAAVQPRLKLVISKLGPRHWRLAVREPDPLPGFGAAIVHEALVVAGAREPQVTVAAHDATGWTLEARWEE
jgi:uncharacterized protein (TIGR02265 family)